MSSVSFPLLWLARTIPVSYTHLLPAFSDDSGFCAAALRGAPGVLSARWAGPEKNFSHAMALVNERAGNSPDRRAWFVAALCLAWPDGHTETYIGRVDGTMTWPPRGRQGFGYDPLFIPCLLYTSRCV